MKKTRILFQLCSRSSNTIMKSTLTTTTTTNCSSSSSSLLQIRPTHQPISTLTKLHNPLSSSSSSSSSSLIRSQFLAIPNSNYSLSSSLVHRFLSTKSSYSDKRQKQQLDCFQDEESEGEDTDGREEEDEADPMVGVFHYACSGGPGKLFSMLLFRFFSRKVEIGDGGGGGGVVLGDTLWGKQALSIANEVLLQFGDDMKLFAFKIYSSGYIYVRLDKISNKYGLPSMEEIKNFKVLYEKQLNLYRQQLEERGEYAEIPDDLALEVSSPGVRLLKVPDDLDRFKDMPMRVSYIEEENKKLQKEGVFLLESFNTESEECTWRLANVKENRDSLGKGRPFGREQKDWRLQIPFEMMKKVTLYIPN